MDVTLWPQDQRGDGDDGKGCYGGVQGEVGVSLNPNGQALNCMSWGPSQAPQVELRCFSHGKDLGAHWGCSTTSHLEGTRLHRVGEVGQAPGGIVLIWAMAFRMIKTRLWLPGEES